MLRSDPIPVPVLLILGSSVMGRPDAQLDEQVPCGYVAAERLATNHGVHAVADVLGDQPGVEALFSGGGAGGTVGLVDAAVAYPALTPVIAEELTLVGGEQHPPTQSGVTLRTVLGHTARGLPLGAWRGNGKWSCVRQAFALHRGTEPHIVTNRRQGVGINAGMTVPKEAVDGREKMALVGGEGFASVSGVMTVLASLPVTALHFAADDAAHLGFRGGGRIHG